MIILLLLLAIQVVIIAVCSLPVVLILQMNNSFKLSPVATLTALTGETFLKHREFLEASAQKSRNSLDVQILTLSSAGLAFTPTIIGAVGDIKRVEYLPWIFLSFTVSIASTILSLWLSEVVCQTERKKYDALHIGQTNRASQMDRKSILYGRILSFANPVAMISFIFAIILLAIFSWKSISYKAEIQDKKISIHDSTRQ